MSDDTDKPFPRVARKPRPVMPAQRLKRQACDDLERRVGEAAGAVTSGVRGRRQPAPLRTPATFASKLRERRTGGSGSSAWRV